MATGLLRPFRRDERFGFARGDSLEGRLAALVAADGGLPWKPEMDSGVDKLRNQRNVPMLEQFAQVYVGDVFRKYEPAVFVRRVRASRENEQLNLTVETDTLAVPVRL